MFDLLRFNTINWWTLVQSAGSQIVRKTIEVNVPHTQDFGSQSSGGCSRGQPHAIDHTAEER